MTSIDIKIDSQTHTIQKSNITYWDVVGLVYPALSNPTYNIAYRNGPNTNPSGTLLSGNSVNIQNDMEFDVIIPFNATNAKTLIDMLSINDTYVWFVKLCIENGQHPAVNCSWNHYGDVYCTQYGKLVIDLMGQNKASTEKLKSDIDNAIQKSGLNASDCEVHVKLNNILYRIYGTEPISINNPDTGIERSVYEDFFLLFSEQTKNLHSTI